MKCPTCSAALNPGERHAPSDCVTVLLGRIEVIGQNLAWSLREGLSPEEARQYVKTALWSSRRTRWLREEEP